MVLVGAIKQLEELAVYMAAIRKIEI